MINFFKKLFGRGETFVQSHKLYDEVLSLSARAEAVADETLTAISQEQITMREEIDQLVHEITLKKQAIMKGAGKAQHLQQIKTSLRNAVDEVKETLDDAVEAVEDAFDGR